MEWTAVSSTLPPRWLGSDAVAAVRSAPYLHPCFPGCRFYELPWALIHLCHTQAPLLGLLLLAHWLGCRWEGPAGHIRFLQRRTKTLRVGQRERKKKKEEVVVWVWTGQCFHQKKMDESVRMFFCWGSVWPKLKGERPFKLVWSTRNLRQWI